MKNEERERKRNMKETNKKKKSGSVFLFSVSTKIFLIILADIRFFVFILKRKNPVY